jgi:predicted nuclease with TOPRIM domain
MQQLDAMKERAQRTSDLLAIEKRKYQESQAEKESLLRGEQDEQAEIERTEAELQRMREQAAEHTERVSQARRSMAQVAERLDHVTKSAVEKESDLEKLGMERIAILRRCRLEETPLPFVRGSLEDIPMEDAEVRSHDKRVFTVINAGRRRDVPVWKRWMLTRQTDKDLLLVSARLLVCGRLTGPLNSISTD